MDLLRLQVENPSWPPTGQLFGQEWVDISKLSLKTSDVATESCLRVRMANLESEWPIQSQNGQSRVRRHLLWRCRNYRLPRVLGQSEAFKST